MRLTKFIIAAGALALGTTGAQAATVTATGKAKILAEVTVVKTADLDFGTIVPGAAASTVDVSSAGARSCGAGLTCSAATTAAAFNITAGDAGYLVDISSDATVNLVSGANAMTASLTPSSSQITLAGGDAFTVGGSLTVGAHQAAGTYSGDFNVTVNYH